MSRRTVCGGAACDRQRTRVCTRACVGGQGSVEYLVVLSLLSLALVVGPDSPLEQVVRAFADRYQQFTYAMSRP